MLQTLNIVWKQFSERKLRASLTIIGIFIGIAALVALVMLSDALKGGVTGALDSFGTDTIFMAPKASLGTGQPTGTGVMTLDDVRIIENVPQVRKVGQWAQTKKQVEYGRESFRYSIDGNSIDEDYESFINQDILTGRYLTADDVGAVNIGYNIANKYFEKPIPLGAYIKIDGSRYRVVGIFAYAGESAKDDAINLNINDVRKILDDQKAITAIIIKISPGADIVAMDKRISDTLERYRGKKDFDTITPAKLKEQISGVYGIIDIVVLSIAAISLLVGALGIMNSMYTSVLQRTREIGTMKAIGATNGQILMLFLIESGILGFVGGFVGIVVGTSMAMLTAIPLNALGIYKFVILPTPGLLIGALLFSVILGMLSGLLPAYRASKLKPVDALRYE